MDAEQYRHECEVRSVLAMGNKLRMKEYMDLCEEKRGKAAADKLRKDVREKLIQMKANENGGGNQSGTCGATTSQQIHHEASSGNSSAAGIQAGEAGKAAGGTGENRRGNKSTDKDGHNQATMF